MLAIDPKQTRVVAMLDDAPPDAPAFVYRYRTKRQAMEAVRLLNAADAVKDSGGDEAADFLLRSISIGLVGFRGVNDPDTGEPLKFERAVTEENGEKVARVPAVLDALTGSECWRMANRAITAQYLSEKNFYSSASSPTAGAEPSVETATAESAPTPPPQPTP